MTIGSLRKDFMKSALKNELKWKLSYHFYLSTMLPLTAEIKIGITIAVDLLRSNKLNAYTGVLEKLRDLRTIKSTADRV